MSQAQNFAELMAQRTAELASRQAFTFLGESPEVAAHRLSYGELDGRARSVAQWLRQSGPRGEPVLILQSSGPRFLSSFLGCLYAGAIAVPVSPPSGRAHHVERILAIVKDTGTRVLLTDSTQAPDISRLLADAGFPQVRCLAIDRIDQDDAQHWRLPRIMPEDLAFLQYTPGSIGEPRGVMVRHDALMAHQSALARALRTGADSVIGGWPSWHHGLGLVTQVLHPLWLGASAVFLAPGAFLRQPVEWLRMVSDHRITAGGGPNFGYELCLQRVTDDQLAGLDLSTWRTAINAGEPVRAGTVNAFADRFAPVGLRREALFPYYSVPSAALFICAGVPGRDAAERTLDASITRVDPARAQVPARPVVSCGRPGDVATRIVDPDTRQTLPDGTIGEVWVHTHGHTGGYWRRPVETCQVFRATTAEGDSGFVRTGDLGTVIDGELYVTGQHSENVVLAGRDLDPRDVERTVQKVSLLFGSGAAFAVNTGREQMVLVQEVRTSTRREVSLSDLAAKVQRCVSHEFGVAADNVVLVRPGTVRRATGSRLQRATMRQLFLSGEIRPLHQVLHPELEELVRPARDAERAG